MSTSIGSTGITFPNGTVQSKPMIGGADPQTISIKIPRSDGTFWVIGMEQSGDIGIGNTTGILQATRTYTQAYSMVTSVVYNNDPDNLGAAYDTGGITNNAGAADASMLTAITGAGGAVVRTSVPSTNKYWFLNGLVIGSSAV